MKVFRLHYNAPVTLTFTLASFIILIVSQMTGGAANILLFSVYRAPLSDPLLYPRLFGHALGHADLNHFFGNFVIILLVGPMLEEKYGGKQLAVMMVVTAFITGVMFIALTPPNVAMLGASGIVFMFMLLASFTNLQKGRVPLTLVLALTVFLGREVYSGVATESNISHLTHIIGGLCGALFGYVVNRRPINR